MSTYVDIVSRISNTIKSINKDDRTSRRYILSVFLSKLELLISSKLHDRSLFRETSLYTEIPCFEMEYKDKYECDNIEFTSSNYVMRSVKKLPPLVNSRFGESIKEVTNIDGTVEYRPITQSKYRRNLKREGKDPNQRYFIIDGHLVLPHTTTETVRLLPLTLETYKIESCDKDYCKSYWDYEVPNSSKLTDIAVQQTLQELGFHKQVVEDEKPNLNSNEK
tara:strand:- start:6749 stop:7411 length:663 start_codon:yes stop_codon:yes gene_type:complete